MILKPYKYLGTWVFDDEATGLNKEAFVAGVPEILEGLLAANNIPLAEAEKGFKLTFSAVAFPGYQLCAIWEREEGGGNWYKEKETGATGWLCPALFKYFESAPAALFIRADALAPEERPLVSSTGDGSLWDIWNTEALFFDVLNFLQRAATPKRADGTYDYDREALEQQAKELLNKIPVGESDFV